MRERPGEIVAGQSVPAVRCPVHGLNPRRPCWACRATNGTPGLVARVWFERWLAAGSPATDPEDD